MDLKRLIFDFENQGGFAVSGRCRAPQIDFGSQTDRVSQHRTKSTQTDGRLKNKAWPATCSSSTTGVGPAGVGPAVWTPVQSTVPPQIVWVPVPWVLGAAILRRCCRLLHCAICGLTLRGLRLRTGTFLGLSLSLRL